MKAIRPFFFLGTLIALLCSHPLWSQELPPDSLRSWEGASFAEATWDWIHRNHPDIQLQVEVNEYRPYFEYLVLDRSGKRSVVAESRNELIRKRELNEMYTYLRSRLPVDLNELGNALYVGDEIKVIGDHRKTVDQSIESVKSWLLTVPDGTAQPHEVFGRAIVGAKGDVIAALIGLWNFFRRDWDGAPFRNDNRWIRKLVDVTGERETQMGPGQFIVGEKDFKIKGVRILPSSEKKAPPRETSEKQITSRIQFVISKRGDVFSSFYHYVGVTLMASYASARLKSSAAGILLGKAGAFAESRLHKTTSGLPIERLKRISNDINAAGAGTRFYQISKYPDKYPMGENPLTASSYLKSNPKFKGNYQLIDDRPAAYFGTDVDSKYWTQPMDVSELRMRFEYALWVDHMILNPVILSSTIDGDRLYAGLAKYLSEGATDSSLNQMILDFTNGYRGKSAAKNSYATRTDGMDFTVNPSQLEMHISTEYNGARYQYEKVFSKIKILLEQIGRLEKSRPLFCHKLFL